MADNLENRETPRAITEEENETGIGAQVEESELDPQILASTPEISATGTRKTPLSTIVALSGALKLSEADHGTGCGPTFFCCNSAYIPFLGCFCGSSKSEAEPPINALQAGPLALGCSTPPEGMGQFFIEQLKNIALGCSIPRAFDPDATLNRFQTCCLGLLAHCARNNTRSVQLQVNLNQVEESDQSSEESNQHGKSKNPKKENPTKNMMRAKLFPMLARPSFCPSLPSIPKPQLMEKLPGGIDVPKVHTPDVNIPAGVPNMTTETFDLEEGLAIEKITVSFEPVNPAIPKGISMGDLPQGDLPSLPGKPQLPINTGCCSFLSRFTTTIGSLFYQTCPCCVGEAETPKNGCLCGANHVSNHQVHPQGGIGLEGTVDCRIRCNIYCGSGQKLSFNLPPNKVKECLAGCKEGCGNCWSRIGECICSCCEKSCDVAGKVCEPICDCLSAICPSN